MNKELLDRLKIFGLSDYEARTFLAINSIEEGTASQVAKVSGIPRASVYDTLRSLENRGVVLVEKGKPFRYRAVPTTAALDNLKTYRQKELGSIQDKLEEAQEVIAEEISGFKVRRNIVDESYWTIRGEEKVWDKMREVILEAKKSIIIGGSEDVLLFSEELNQAREREVEILAVIAGEFDKSLVIPGVFVLKTDNPDPYQEIQTLTGLRAAILLVVDRKECLITTRDWDESEDPLRERTCLWMRSEGLAKIFSAFMYLLREKYL